MRFISTLLLVAAVTASLALASNNRNRQQTDFTKHSSKKTIVSVNPNVSGRANLIHFIVKRAKERKSPWVPKNTPGFDCSANTEYDTPLLFCKFKEYLDYETVQTTVADLETLGTPVTFANYFGNGKFQQYEKKKWAPLDLERPGYESLKSAKPSMALRFALEKTEEGDYGQVIFNYGVQ